jgi:hypothetical protein
MSCCAVLPPPQDLVDNAWLASAATSYALSVAAAGPPPPGCPSPLQLIDLRGCRQMATTQPHPQPKPHHAQPPHQVGSSGVGSPGAGGGGAHSAAHTPRAAAGVGAAVAEGSGSGGGATPFASAPAHAELAAGSSPASPVSGLQGGGGGGGLAGLGSVGSSRAEEVASAAAGVLRGVAGCHRTPAAGLGPAAGGAAWPSTGSPSLPEPPALPHTQLSGRGSGAMSEGEEGGPGGEGSDEGGGGPRGGAAGMVARMREFFRRSAKRGE